jgi:hypothetical protein
MGLCGYVAMWLCGYVAMWLCGYVAMGLCGYVAFTVFQYVALEKHSKKRPIGQKTEKPKIQETLHKSGLGLMFVGFW